MSVFLGRTKRQAERGDTLIEVLLAVTIFSLIVVGALAIMNQGMSAARRSLETTLARQVMDGQAESLRFMHESYVAGYKKGVTYNLNGPKTPAGEYYRIIENAKANAHQVASDLNGAATCPTTAPAGGFAIDPVTAQVKVGSAMMKTATTYPQLVYNATGGITAVEGVWIEAVRTAEVAPGAPGSHAGFIDFHIRTCWMVPGSDVPETLGTIVRLYEPRG